jgi:hypothetical protein
MPDSESRHERSDPSPDALRRLEERLDRASRAAERLIADARQERSSPDGKPPPAGWQSRGTGSQDGTELELLAQLIQSVRDLVPAELQRRVADALRELLLVLRALIDCYLERLERPEHAPTEMEDIPIS